MAEINSPGYIETIASSRRKTKENLKVDQLIPSEILEDSGDAGIKLLLEKYYEFMNISEFIYDQDESYTDLVLDSKAIFRIDDPNLANNKFFSDYHGTSSSLKLTSTTGQLPVPFTVTLAGIDNADYTITVAEQSANQMPAGTIVQYKSSNAPISGLANNATYFVVYNSSNQIKLSNSISGSPIQIADTAAPGTHTIEGISNTISYPLERSNIFISNGNELPGSLGSKREVDDDTEEGLALGKTFQVAGLRGLNGLAAELTTPVKNWVGPGPSYTLNAIEDAMDIDKNSDPSIDPTNQYLEMMQKEIAEAIPRSQAGLSVNKSTLYKRILDFYKVRGSSDSVEMFFRLLFDEEVEVSKPYDDTLIPSSGNWDESTNQFVSRKGFVSDSKIRLHDNYRYQKYSYLIKSGLNKTTWDQVYSRLVHPAGFIFFGEISILLQAIREKLRTPDGSLSDNNKEVIEKIKNLSTGFFVDQLIRAYPRTNRLALSSMPGIQPGIVGVEDLPFLIEAIASVFEPSIKAYINQTAQVSPVIDSSGNLTAVVVSRTGSGYTSAPSITITDSSSGSTATATALLNNLGGIESVNSITGDTTGYNPNTASAAVGTLAAGTGKIGKIAINAQTRHFDDLLNLYNEAPGTASNNVGWTNVDASDSSGNPPPSGSVYLSFMEGATQFTGDDHRTNLEPGQLFRVSGWYNTQGNAGAMSLALRGGATTGAAALIGAIGIPAFPAGQDWTYFDIEFRANDAVDYWHLAVDRHTAYANDRLRLSEVNWSMVDAPSLPGNKLYNTPPTITIGPPTATDADGKLLPLGTDANNPNIRIQAAAKFLLEPTGVQYIKITNPGSGYDLDTTEVEVSEPAYPTTYIEANEPYYAVTEAYPVVNPQGQVDGILIARPGRGHIEPPTVTITGTGTGATAEALLYPSEITAVEITNPGQGYQFNPRIKVNSSMIDRTRVREVLYKLIIPLNHINDGSAIIEENDYFNLKGDSYYTSSKKFNMNQKIEQFEGQTIESNNINNINTFNINSFIDIE